jgi:hypothetical protein
MSYNGDLLAVPAQSSINALAHRRPLDAVGRPRQAGVLFIHYGEVNTTSTQ